VPEDPRAKLFFDQWEKDTHEGITLRSVHNRLIGHIDRTDERFRGHSSELKKIGERIATVEQNDRRDAEDRALSQAGRHNTPGGVAIPTPVQPFPPYMPPGVVVHVRGGEGGQGGTAQGGQGGQGGNVGGDYIGPGAQVASGTGSHIIPPPAMIAAAAVAQQQAPPAPRAPTRVSSWPPAWMRLPTVSRVLTYGFAMGVTAVATTIVHLTTAAAPHERVVYLPAPPSTTEPVETAPTSPVYAVAPPTPTLDAGLPVRLPAAPPPATFRSAK
jgi:hypothetical protein